MNKLIAIFVAIALCACLFVGCSSPEAVENVSKSSSFVIVEDAYGYYIVYHRDTKVMYALSSTNYNMGNFTVLVNADGTPMVWQGEE